MGKADAAGCKILVQILHGRARISVISVIKFFLNTKKINESKIIKF